jgi:hypothetical protein
MTRTLAAVLAAAFCALSATRPLAAQAPDETALLATSVATVLADSLLGMMGRDGPIIWRNPSGGLNLAVARILQSHRRFRGPVSDPWHTPWIGIRRVTSDADTVRVIMELGQDYGGSGPLTFWEEERAYLFARASAGWQFVRSHLIEHADGGGVRG